MNRVIDGGEAKSLYVSSTCVVGNDDPRTACLPAPISAPPGALPRGDLSLALTFCRCGVSYFCAVVQCFQSSYWYVNCYRCIGVVLIHSQEEQEQRRWEKHVLRRCNQQLLGFGLKHSRSHPVQVCPRMPRKDDPLPMRFFGGPLHG